MALDRSDTATQTELLETSHFSLVKLLESDESGISDEALMIFTWAIFGVLCQIVDIFGIVTNIINIICFIKQDFRDPVTISLLGLAVSDLFSLLTLVGMNIMYTPAVLTSDLPVQEMEVSYLIFITPHIAFTRVSSWVTAVITMERCLCIIAPLKVKSLITSRKMSVIIVSVYTVLLFSTAPFYVVNRLDMQYSPLKNKTILVRVSTSDREKVESISYIINNFTIPLIAFVVIVICTVILVFKLREVTKWRKMSTASTQVDRVSSRNQKVAKMVVMISCLFIACFAPLCMVALAVAFEPSLTYHGKYVKIGILLGGLGLILESINSSMNIFIYYHMSSKYRDIFRKLCGVSFICNITDTSKFHISGFHKTALVSM